MSELTAADGAPPRQAPQWVQRAARRLYAALRRMARTWRASLQLRVIAMTTGLCVLVMAILGSYLFGAIGDGLIADRTRSAEAEAQSLATTAQATFDGAPATTADDLFNTATTLVEKTLAPPATDVTRYVILTKGLRNPQPTMLGTIRSGGISEDAVRQSLRQAVADDPKRQKTQVVDVTNPATGEPVPAVVVGSQLTLAREAGAYDLYFVYPLDREEATLRHIANSFALGGIILVLLVGAIAWVVARSVATPVRRAAAVAERLSSGHLGERLSSRGHDEIALLGKSFNAMADSLQTQIHQLESLSRVQQRFVSDVSHELRTPLTTIRMAADLLHDSRAEMAPTMARSAELLHNELDRFEDLLSDLLEISRFDAGAAALEVDPTDLVALVERVLAGAEQLAKVKGSVLRVRAQGEVSADVDARRVERILRNLVVNAIEHGEGGPVTIHLASNDTAVAVVVEDRGVGLKPGESALVFTRFWRADPARTRTTGGTGLGLAISLEDARLHNGWLQAWGDPGHGSRFRLTLPRHPDVPITTSPLPLARPQAQA